MPTGATMSFLASPQQELGFSNGSCRFSSPAGICCRADREKKGAFSSSNNPKIVRLN